MTGLPVDFNSMSVISGSLTSVGSSVLDGGFSRGSRLMVYVDHSRKDTNASVKFTLTRTLRVGCCSRSMLGRVLSHESTGRFKTSTTGIDSFGHCRNLSGGSTSFFQRDTLVYRLTGRRSVVIVKHTTSIMLAKRRVPRVDVCVATPFTVHIHHVVRLGGLSLGRTVGLIHGVSRGRRSCCRSFANGH